MRGLSPTICEVKSGCEIKSGRELKERRESRGGNAQYFGRIDRKERS